MPFLNISQLGEPISTRDKDELRFDCPYCDDEGKHLYVNTRKGVYHCFRCGGKGRTNVKGIGVEGIHLTDFGTESARARSELIALPHAHRDLITPVALKYLVKRGIKESDVEKWRMYCAAPNSKYFGRLIIPYRPIQGYCRYFVARAYTSLSWPKYLNPPGGRDTLFFAPNYGDNQQLWELDELVLVEGPFDCIKAGRHGPAAALLGKEMKHEQARIAVAAFSRVYILLDNEGTKNKLNALKIKDLLSVHVETVILECPKKDPGEMEYEDFRELFGS